MRRLRFLLWVLVFAALPAQADTLYTYTSDAFTLVQGGYQPGDRIIGSFILSDLFVPQPFLIGRANVSAYILSYSFTDGHQFLTQDNSSYGAQFGVPFFQGEAIDPNTRPFGFRVLLHSNDGSGGISIDVVFDYFITAWMKGGPQVPTTHQCKDNAELCFDDSNVSAMTISGLDNRAPGGKGTWTKEPVTPQTSVPEPGALASLTVGLLALCILLLRSFRPSFLLPEAKGRPQAPDSGN